MSFDLAWLRKHQQGAKARAARAGITFDLPDPDYAAKLFDKQRGRCHVSGVEFTTEEFKKAQVPRPFQPSLDRIHSDQGYTEGNVRLVCVAVNFGMNQWGEDVFLRLARAAAEHQPLKIEPTELNPDAVWYARQLARIADAEAVLVKLPKAKQEKQRHVIAGLKSALAKGRKRLSEIAKKAAATRRRNRLSKP